MTVKELKLSLAGVPDEALVVIRFDEGGGIHPVGEYDCEADIGSVSYDADENTFALEEDLS